MEILNNISWPGAVALSVGLIAAGAAVVALFMAAGGKWDKD